MPKPELSGWDCYRGERLPAMIERRVIKKRGFLRNCLLQILNKSLPPPKKQYIKDGVVLVSKK